MGQVNINTGTSSGRRGNSGAAAIFGMGMMMAVSVLAFVLVALVVLWFVIRPIVFSGPPAINVSVPAQQLPAHQSAPQPAPAAPARP
jgi:flagellar biosynthesis/type III secretory pathway M-ring protein FliF/YscJ